MLTALPQLYGDTLVRNGSFTQAPCKPTHPEAPPTSKHNALYVSKFSGNASEFETLVPVNDAHPQPPLRPNFIIYMTIAPIPALGPSSTLYMCLFA